MFRLTRFMLPLLVAVVAVTSASAAPKPKTISITIAQIAFAVPAVTANVGDTIEWINKDVVDHSATAKSGAFDVLLPAGKKGRLVLKAAGTFDYYCKFHPNMAGRITVKAN